MGKVYLVGAGPGDPGLMTIKGKALLETCDVVLYDALVSDEILAMINPAAELIHAGKRRGKHSMLQEEISELLIAKARICSSVVRLKGGDPFIFGRGGEEMSAIREAGIDVEVVPGITSGIAAPAYAGVPLTHRDYSSSVIFVTGHESIGKYRPQVNWSAIAHSAETIVVYMGLHYLAEITQQLQLAGLPSDTPVMLVRQGTRADQSELWGTLANIVAQMQSSQFAPPAIAVIGNVVRFRQCYTDGTAQVEN
ncbi:MAG: uroporphyrinogen-III C-methyltransferase [Pseudanabaena sp. ELA607]|jgi:uroporphyrin-III C-methyltransferase